MAKEPLATNPGISEHRNRDGITVQFQPGYLEQLWGFHSPGTDMTYMDGRYALTGLLRKEFLDTTRIQMGESAWSMSPIKAELIQMGVKNAIYLVSPDMHSKPFIVVMSKDIPKLKKEVETEYRNLRGLRRELVRQRLPLFVPQAYVLAENRNVSGFSFEYLPDHFELRMTTALFGDDSTYSYFRMSDQKAAAQDFNKRYADPLETLINFRKPSLIDPSSPHFKIKAHMAGRLYIMHALTRSVPAEFEVNAGDLMANPAEEDFNLQLITVRGGWKRVRDFRQWAENYNIPETRVIEGIEKVIPFSPFDRSREIVETGMEIGRRIMAHAA